MIALKNILVATDFSESAAVALAYGRDLARTFNARLHVVHVVEDVLMRYSPEVSFSVPELQRDLEKAAVRDLAADPHLRDDALEEVPLVRNTRRDELQSDRLAELHVFGAVDIADSA